MSTIVAVQTQGEPPAEYVTLFRLDYSDDCSSFVSILDTSGNIVVRDTNIFW